MEAIVGAPLKICSKCKKAGTCTKICPELEDKMPKEKKYTDPRTININPEDGAHVSDDLRDDWEYEKYKDKGLGDLLGAQIREFDFESVRKDFLIWAFKNNERELKKQFIDFLKCNTMSKIAKLSGCTKQNIFKTFAKKIGLLAKVLKKNEGSPNVDKVRTPRIFKQLFALG